MESSAEFTSSPLLGDASDRTRAYRVKYGREDGLKTYLNAGYKALQYRRPTRVHYAICDRVQHGPNRQCLLAPRSTGKSTIKCFANSWFLLQDPQTKIIDISKSSGFAKQTTETTLRIIQNFDPVKHLAPKTTQRKSGASFDVSEKLPGRIHSSVKAYGLEGMVTSAKGHIINLDDIETTEHADSEAERASLRKMAAEFRNLTIPNEDYRIIYWGTPHTEESIYFNRAAHGYSVWIWPICYPGEQLYKEMEPYLAKEILDDIARDPSLMTGGLDPRIGQITDPQWFSELEVRERLQEGWPTFLMQSMMVPSLGDPDLYALRMRDLIVMPLQAEVGPEFVEWTNADDFKIDDIPCRGFGGDGYYKPKAHGQNVPYAHTAMVIDKSDTGKDDTSWKVGAGLNGNIFLLDSGSRGYGGSMETLEFLAEKCVEWRVKVVYEDAQQSKETWRNLFLPVLQRVCADKEILERYGLKEPWICGFDPEGYRHFTQKEKTTASILGWATASHRLVVNRRVLENDRPPRRARESAEIGKQRTLVYQMTRLQPRKDCLKFNDQTDSLSMLVHYWRQMLALDQEKRVKQRQVDDRMEFERQWKEREEANSLAPRRQNTWISFDREAAQNRFADILYGTN